MQNNSGRPRKVRIKHGGRRHNRNSWNRKEHRGTGPTLASEQEMSTDYADTLSAKGGQQVFDSP